MRSKVDVLGKCGLLNGIDETLWGQVAEELSFRPVTFSDGQAICRFGDPGDRLFVIADGEVAIRIPRGTGERHIARRTVGEIIGEQGLVDGGMRTATAIAQGEVSTFALDRASLDAVKDETVKAAIWRNLAVILSGKLAQASQARGKLVAQNADAQAMLKAFVNEHGLGMARDSVCDEYRRECVVIWFSDLAGFGALAEQLCPGDVAAIVRQCMEAQSDAIESRGGYVDKFMGDGLMAYWVFPDSGPARQQACRAAVEAAAVAVRAVQGLGTPLDGYRLGLRVGLHVGEALSGNFGSEKRYGFTLIGKDVNLAARLEQAKEGKGGEALGPVRVSEPLYAHLTPDMQAALPVAAPIKVKEAECVIHSAAGVPEQGGAA